MNPNGSWNFNPMASYPLCEQPISVRRWNVPPYDNKFGYPHATGRPWTKILPRTISILSASADRPRTTNNCLGLMAKSEILFVKQLKLSSPQEWRGNFDKYDKTRRT